MTTINNHQQYQFAATVTDEPLLIDSLQLAKMLKVSPSYIFKQRHRIITGQRFGRVWRFNRAVIVEKIKNGETIFV